MNSTLTPFSGSVKPVLPWSTAMIGVLIIAHDTLPDSLVKAVTHVLGTTPAQLETLSVKASDDPFDLLPGARAVVDRLDTGDGVLIFSDIYGATPCNIACQLLVPGQVEGVAGASLPMLMRALTYRNEPLEALVARAVSGGREGVARMPCSDTEKCSIKKPKS